MYHIGQEEKKQALASGVWKPDEHRPFSSFHPRDMPTRVSMLQWQSEVVRGEEIASIPSSPQRFLPCHYFDYICGSSTGA